MHTCKDAYVHRSSKEALQLCLCLDVQIHKSPLVSPPLPIDMPFWATETPFDALIGLNKGGACLQCVLNPGWHDLASICIGLTQYCIVKGTTLAWPSVVSLLTPSGPGVKVDQDNI